jgi:hypothetical protein
VGEGVPARGKHHLLFGARCAVRMRECMYVHVCTSARARGCARCNLRARYVSASRDDVHAVALVSPAHRRSPHMRRVQGSGPLYVINIFVVFILIKYPPHITHP